MERIGTLLEKLNAQYAANAGTAEMLFTLQMLQQELVLKNGHASKNGSAGVSVFMPAKVDLHFANGEAPPSAAPVKEAEKLVFELDPEVTEAEEPVVLAAMAAPVTTVLQNTVHETPTFTRQAETSGITIKKEVNQSIVAERPSLNDMLDHAPKPELASMLQPEAIKDLRKAISINDRYQFISHLFKGDESMYERSIKTINGFNILPEATFWIRRELAVKLSWRDEDQLVQQFNQLVSRRFM